VHVNSGRLNTCRFSAARAGCCYGLALAFFLIGSKGLQNAVAEGDTRTIAMHHLHTGEDITVTFKRDGRYDAGALDKLNWFLRDWRKSESTHMDPHLIDLVWEVQRETGASEPVQIVCGYRSPATNAMLRHRSSGVARFSQHMLGHAMDFYIPGVPLEKLREYGLRLQRGGVGFYPESGSPFVHMDTGGIRMWPRMTREQLVRVFPDGRTVHIPADGRPLSGYALALTEIRRRGGTPSENSLEAARVAGVDIGPVVASNEASANPIARLFGLAKSNDDEDEGAEATASGVPAPPAPPKHPVLAAVEHGVQAGAQLAEKVSAKAASKVAEVVAKPRPIQTVALAAPNAPAPQDEGTHAATSPNQIIVARGYWEGPADGVAPVQSARLQRAAVVMASAIEDTGSVGPFAQPREETATPALALAYAEPSERSGVVRSAAAPATTPAVRANASQAIEPSRVGTTIAVKRAADQAASTVLSASARVASVVKNAARFENPWLHAVMVSPSVQHFMTTLALGAGDFRALAALMVKPSSSVVMTFSADPNSGLTHERFSGAAIVFVSTVSYPARTASLL